MLGMELSTGVDSVVENIGRLPSDLFTETCHLILTHLQGQSRAVDLVEICDRFERCGGNLGWKAVQDISRLLSFHFRSAAQSNISADLLVSRLEEGSSRWTQPALQVLHQLWVEHGALVRAQQQPQPMASVGQLCWNLVDVQWKLGMAVSSDTCRSLNSPLVTLLLRLEGSSGEMSHRSFEMTVPQFQNFYRQFKEMAAVLETV